MRFDPCQFYYIYQGESTQHGGRAPQLRKLKVNKAYIGPHRRLATALKTRRNRYAFRVQKTFCIRMLFARPALCSQAHLSNSKKNSATEATLNSNEHHINEVST